jgi:hypothetical protein
MTLLGTHNLLDGKAEADNFASVIMFTEAPPGIHADEVNQTHRLFRARRQRDLVIAVHDQIAREVTDFKVRYKYVHPGVVRVTPHRGILILTFTFMGKRYAVFCEHRINAWYRPWIRGERWFRRRMWHRHTAMSNRLQQQYLEEGYIVIAGGDPNAPEGVNAYPLLHETVDVHLDRVACSKRIANIKVLRRAGSDHHRVVAESNVLRAA